METPTKRSKRSRQGGFIISMETVIVSSILVVGMIVGIIAMRDAMVAEVKDAADGVNSINDSFSFAGFAIVNSGGTQLVSVAGGSFSDTVDQTSGQGASGVISYSQAATAEP